MILEQETKQQKWFKSVWQPKARYAVHLTNTLTRFLNKNQLTNETTDAILPNINELRSTLNELQRELTEVERKKFVV
jgi:hypothetical protein